MLSNGHWTDFISDFMAYTEGELTTEIHRRWAAISLVAGALERRVWVPAGDRIAFPNLYVILVAPPGSGKFIIEKVRELWAETPASSSPEPAFDVAPDSVSRASLVDDLNQAKSTFQSPSGPITYNSLLIASEEFEVLLPAYDPPFIALLNKIFMNSPFHRETRRHGPAKDIKILNPQFNILAGATPAYFMAHFPEEAWDTGLIRRILMIYSSEPPLKDIFLKIPDLSRMKAALIRRLSQLSALYGEATWTDEALKTVQSWHLASGPPEPKHSKLRYYNRSRTLFILKLSLISAVARAGIPNIEPIDVHRAFEWLFEAEALMPDIFRAMVGKSDSQIIEELHLYMQSSWIKNKQKPLRTDEITTFLSHRLPAEKIFPVLNIAEATGTVAHPAGALDLWIPRPKHLHGVE